MIDFFWRWVSLLKKKEWLYLSLAGLFGLIMVALNPPFVGVPDEQAHYLKAASFAQGYWRCDKNNQISRSAANLPHEIDSVDVPGANEDKIPWEKMKKELFAQPDLSPIKFSGAVCGIPTTAYLPQAFGVFLSEKWGLSSLAGFYLARIFNLVIAVFITFWAIKRAPFGKNIFLAIALLPMTIQQYASVSYDALHISLSFYFFALVLHLAFGKKEKINRRDIWELAGVAFFGLNIKSGMLLFPLVLLISQEKFENKRQAWVVKIAIAFCAVAGFALSRIIFPDLWGATTVSNDNLDPSAQLAYVFWHPFDFLYSVSGELYERAGYFLESFLIRPGYLKTSLPFPFYLFLLAGIILLIKNDESQERAVVCLKTGARLWMAIIFVLNLLAVFAVLYAGWNKVGANEISGMQGRYFLSFAPVLFLTFFGVKIKTRFEFLRKNFNFIFSAFFAIVFSAFFLFIFGYYYRTGFYLDRRLNDRMATWAEIREAEVGYFKKTVAQKFVQKRENLIGMRIYFNKKNLHSRFILTLRDEHCQKILRERKSKAEDQDTSYFLNWDFAILEEKGAPLCFMLERAEGNFVDVKIFPKKDFNDSNIVLDDEEKDGVLLMDLNYKK